MNVGKAILMAIVLIAQAAFVFSGCGLCGGSRCSDECYQTEEYKVILNECLKAYKLDVHDCQRTAAYLACRGGSEG